MLLIRSGEQSSVALGRMLDCCHHHDHQRTIAMATPSLRSLLAERQAAAMVLARQAALRAVKRRIQKEGRIKLGSVPLSTLTRLGNDYLRKHPELLVEA
jgi:hypothetical protein